MQETTRIKKLFFDLYEGSPWLDVTLMDTLKDISAAQAAGKVLSKWNSIWEIVNHLVSWRRNVLQRVQGNIIQSPADNFFREVTDTSPAAWATTLLQLKETQQEWIAFLEKFNEAGFSKIYPPNGLSYYEHIHGILQHDAYHLGQIVMLAKHAGEV